MNIETAKNYINKNKYDEALGVLKDILKSDDSSKAAYFEMGKVYLLQGKYPKAIKALKNSIGLNGSEAYARVLLAKAYKESRLYTEAIREFKKSIKLGYKEENLAMEITKIYEELGKSKLSDKYIAKAGGYSYGSSAKKNDGGIFINEQLRLIQANNFHGRFSGNLKICKSLVKHIPVKDKLTKNILLNETEIAQRKTILNSKPRSLVVSLTNKCNLKCIMCKIRDIKWDLPEKAKNEIIGLFPYLEKIIWQGGEAFLYKGFEELIDEAGKHKIKQTIITNGLLINEKIARKIASQNIELTFSVDGVTKKVYEYIRPGANFEKVLDSINLVNRIREESSSKMTTRLNVYIMNSNCAQIPQFIDFAKKYKFNSVLLNSAGCDFENYKENMFYLNKNKGLFEQADDMRDELAQKANKYNIKLENRMPSKMLFKKITEGGNKRKTQYDLESKKLFCHVPWQRLYIDNAGFVRPECQCPINFSIGNIKEESIKEMWNGKKMIEYRKRILSNDINGFCNIDCIYRKIPESNLKYI